MKRAISIALLFGVGGCSGTDVVESTGESQQSLNGDLIQPFGPLVLEGLALPTHDETARRIDTGKYYNSLEVPIDFHGEPASDPLPLAYATLSQFRTTLGFGKGFPEFAVSYYNKGDLGLGRDMHCVNRIAFPDQQIACYVTNYSSGDDFGEFTFGLSRDIAFANMDAGHVLATVAMVYRPLVQAAGGPDPMVFMAFDAAGNLADNAPLDRHGINFANGFKAANPNLKAITHFPPFNETGVNPDPALFGTPGVNFNNHIPSNCLNCHGGHYDPSARDAFPSKSSVTSALFLPWDLDQLEFRSPSGPTASEQTTLRNLNATARQIAVLVRGQAVPPNPPPDVPMVDQIDGWYHNTSRFTVLSGNFDSTYVPGPWTSQAPHGDPNVYSNVIRPSCRGCHLALENPALNFDGGDALLRFAGTTAVANAVASHLMPHALQTQRQFWLSGQPLLLEQFIRQTAFATQIPDAATAAAAADQLHNSGPGRFVTLDPYAISAATLF